MSQTAYPTLDLSGVASDPAPASGSPLSLTLAPYVTADADATLSVGNLSTGVLDTAAATAARTYTLPTAAEVVAAISSASVGVSLDFVVVETASQAITLAVGTGGAALGDLVVAADTSVPFRLRLTNVTSGSEAYVLTRLG